MTPSFKLAVLAYARSQVGVTEVGGNNRGPAVEAWLAGVDLSAGFAWCAAFAYGCCASSATELKVTNPAPRTGGALHFWLKSPDECKVTTPTPGCFYVLDHGKGTGHVGVVEEAAAWAVGGAVTEISGNTFPAPRAGREGDGVYRHVGPPEKTHGGRLLGWLDFDLWLDFNVQTATP